MSRRPRTISPPRQSRRWAGRAAPSRPRLEALEDRCLPATIYWINTAGGQWTDAANWHGGQVPTANDTAVIPYGNVVVTFSAKSTFQVGSLYCQGTLRVESGKLEVLDTSSLNDLEMVSGNLSTQDTLRVFGDFTWAGGTLGGAPGQPSMFELRGTTTASEPTVKALDQVLVCNYGVFDWQGGRITSLRAATFSNKAGAVFLARPGSSNVLLAGSPSFKPTLENIGRYVLDFKGTVEFASVSNYGDLTLNNGRLKANVFAQSAGVTRLEGGSLASSNALTFFGGQLVGGGTIAGTLVNSGARVAPSPTGLTGQTLVVEGNYVQGNAGVLALLVNGQAAAGNYDRLLVKGTATLGGMLEVRGQALPAAVAGDSYTLLGAAGGLSGTFASYAGPRVSGGSLEISYTANEVVATLSNGSFVKPEPGNQPSGKDPTLLNNGSLILVSTTLTGGHSSGSLDQTPSDTGAGHSSGLAASAIGVDVARSLVLNGGLLGLALSGSNRGADLSPSAGEASSTSSSGRLTSHLSPLGGEKASSGRSTDSSGLSEEYLAAMPLNLPELELPSDKELISVEELNRLLLAAGARADILPQAGSQLSVVAALVADEGGGGEGGEQQRDAVLADLFISPLALGDAAVGATVRPAAPVVAQVAQAIAAEAPAEEDGAAEARPPLGGALVVLAAFAGVLVGLTQAERAQRKLCSGPGNRPSRTSRQ